MVDCYSKAITVDAVAGKTTVLQERFDPSAWKCEVIEVQAASSR